MPPVPRTAATSAHRPPEPLSPARCSVRRGLWGLAAGLLLGTLMAQVGYPPAGRWVPVVCLVAGALALWRPGWAVLRAALAGAALLYAAALFTPLVPRALETLTEAQPPQAADAIIVLGGGLHCAEGTQSVASAARLHRGIELWQAGYASRVVLSSQSDELTPAACPRLSDLQRAELGRLFAQPPETLILANVTDTADEAARAAELGREQGWRRVLLVTSPSHSARAAALFRRELSAEVVSVPAQEWRFSLRGETAQDRLSGLNVVLYEWLSRFRAWARTSLGG